ncbi:MAG: NAD-dependent deacylase [Planctomycetota bacterium]
MSLEDDIEKARAILRGARSIAVLTGAGISAESGVPTFRGAEGLWKHFRPEELATPYAFARDPALVWEWYGWRRLRIKDARPNPGHYALVTLEQRCEPFLLITQNVDDLHKVAGSRRMVRLHGSLWESRCLGCGEVFEDRAAAVEGVPRCAKCQGMLRPNVVWFGENLDEEILDQASNAAATCGAFLVVGTSGVVQPAASLALIASRHGARVIEVNPDETPLSHACDVALRGSSGSLLPRIVS